MKDRIGKELTVGDTVVCSGMSSGSSRGAMLEIGIVHSFTANQVYIEIDRKGKRLRYPFCVAKVDNAKT